MVIFYMSLQPIGYFSKILEMKLKLDTGLWFFGWFLERDDFSSSGLTSASLKCWGNVPVFIEMLIMSVMGVINV